MPIPAPAETGPLDTIDVSPGVSRPSLRDGPNASNRVALIRLIRGIDIDPGTLELVQAQSQVSELSIGTPEPESAPVILGPADVRGKFPDAGRALACARPTTEPGQEAVGVLGAQALC